MSGRLTPKAFIDIPAGTPASECPKCAAEIYWVEGVGVSVNFNYALQYGYVTQQPFTRTPGFGFDHKRDCRGLL